MIKYLLIVLLWATPCWAEMNQKYSYQAYPYHNLSFKDRPASEFNNTVIIGSCFYQEWVEGDTKVVKDIFPDGITGVTFEKCNLDNIYVPSGNKIKDGCHRKLKIQNDLSTWILNDDLTPKEPLDKKRRVKTGISVKPKDIPNKKLTKEERRNFEKQLFSTDISSISF